MRTLVAHEPPLAQLLPDREEALAAVRDIDETYQREGLGPGMAKFIAIVIHKDRAADFADQPAPDPAMFGLPEEDDGSRDDVLLGQNLVSNLHYEPDLEALGAASTRIVIAAGAESEGELAHRGGGSGGRATGRRPSSFPATMAVFWGGNTVRPATPRPSPPNCCEVLGT